MKTYRSIGACRVCSSSRLKKFFHLGNQPLANSLVSSSRTKEKKYPLSLSYCTACSLVQLNETVEPRLMFTEYPWVTGTSRGAKDFSFVFADYALAHATSKEPFIFEIGSNDGTFLEPFLKKGLRVLGVDPAKNIGRIARAKKVPTVSEFFDFTCAKKIVRKHGEADIVIARNVLYHLAHLEDVMKGVEYVLSDKGVFIAEFHYGAKMQQELHYDTIYHEHVCYYTLKTFETLLNRFNLFGYDVRVSPINSGGLIVYAGKNVNTKTRAYKSLESQERVKKSNTFEKWKKFAQGSYKHRDQCIALLKDAKQRYGNVVGYGASARSSTLLNFCRFSIKDISCIADGNPLKQGLYTAGSKIPIIDPKKVFASKPGCVIILAWNFAEEITQIIRKTMHFSGPCMVPLPTSPHYNT